MKIIIKVYIRIVLIMFFLAIILSIFNHDYAAFFLFGGSVLSYLYKYFGLVKSKIKETDEEVKKAIGTLLEGVEEE